MTNTNDNIDNVKIIKIIDFQSIISSDRINTHLRNMIDWAKYSLIDSVKDYFSQDKDSTYIYEESDISSFPRIDPDNFFSSLEEMKNSDYFKSVENFNLFNKFTLKIKNNILNTANILPFCVNGKNKDKSYWHIDKSEIAKFFISNFDYKDDILSRVAIIPKGINVVYILPLNFALNGYFSKVNRNELMESYVNICNPPSGGSKFYSKSINNVNVCSLVQFWPEIEDDVSFLNIIIQASEYGEKYREENSDSLNVCFDGEQERISVFSKDTKNILSAYYEYIKDENNRDKDDNSLINRCSIVKFRKFFNDNVKIITSFESFEKRCDGIYIKSENFLILFPTNFFKR